jgi:hypothetical protein
MTGRMTTGRKTQALPIEQTVPLQHESDDEQEIRDQMQWWTKQATPEMSLEDWLELKDWVKDAREAWRKTHPK